MFRALASIAHYRDATAEISPRDRSSSTGPACLHCVTLVAAPGVPRHCQTCTQTLHGMHMRTHTRACDGPALYPRRPCLSLSTPTNLSLSTTTTLSSSAAAGRSQYNADSTGTSNVIPVGSRGKRTRSFSWSLPAIPSAASQAETGGHTTPGRACRSSPCDHGDRFTCDCPRPVAPFTAESCASETGAGAACAGAAGQPERDLRGRRLVEARRDAGGHRFFGVAFVEPSRRFASPGPLLLPRDVASPGPPPPRRNMTGRPTGCWA